MSYTLKNKLKSIAEYVGIVIAGLLITATIVAIIGGIVYGICYNTTLVPANEATVNIYTSDGELIKSYHGNIQFMWQDSTVRFTYNGNTYCYTNCQVEYISNN